MLGALVRTIIIVVVLVAGAAFLLGWWGGYRIERVEPRETVGTSGTAAPRTDPDRPRVNSEKAREVGAEVGERTAAAADQARRAISNGSLTAKIKAKMALDDSVKALDINVDTSGSVVTVSGTVDNDAQRRRALDLARETDGVKQVVDRLSVRH